VAARRDLAFPFTPGHHEDGFLRQLDVRAEAAQPLAANCTEVLVWHTKASKDNRRPTLNSKVRDRKDFLDTNLPALLSSV
jgi:beta-1,3-glucuronyltransferase